MIFVYKRFWSPFFSLSFISFNWPLLYRSHSFSLRSNLTRNQRADVKCRAAAAVYAIVCVSMYCSCLLCNYQLLWLWPNQFINVYVRSLLLLLWLMYCLNHFVFSAFRWLHCSLAPLWLFNFNLVFYTHCFNTELWVDISFPYTPNHVSIKCIFKFTISKSPFTLNERSQFLWLIISMKQLNNWRITHSARTLVSANDRAHICFCARYMRVIHTLHCFASKID